MAESCSISIIVPHRNRVRRAICALESILNQTHRADEIFLIDDGSTDDLTPLEDFCGRHAIGLIRTEHRGVSHARNCGVSHCGGQLIAFLDSDDLWHPQKLKSQLAAHTESGCRISQTAEIWIRNGVRVNQRLTHELAVGDAFELSLRRCAISPSAVMLERELFLEHGGFREELPTAEDYDLWLRLTLRERVCLTPDALVTKHGGHADQLSRTIPAIDRFRIESILRLLTAPDFPAERRASALASLTEKLRVLQLGARKRDPNSVEPLASIAQRAEQLCADFSPQATAEIYADFRSLIAPYLLPSRNSLEVGAPPRTDAAFSQ